MDDDRDLPEANAPEFRGDEWEADATDPTGALDEVGESVRDEVPAEPEGGEIPLANEDRIQDR